MSTKGIGQDISGDRRKGRKVTEGKGEEKKKK